MKAVEKVDTVVIGAGVIGLAVARALQERLSQAEVWLLERASTVATETTSRNSEVIHAGIYYPKNSLKARLCVQGRDLLYNYLRDRNIGHSKLGKLIVPTGMDGQDSVVQNQQIEKLFKQAQQNSVSDLRIISKFDVQAMEPELQLPSDNAVAIHSPSTGILDVHELCQHLWADLDESGVMVAFSTPVDAGSILSNGNIYLQTPELGLECRRVVNCAGLYADQLARSIHQSHKWEPPRQSFCKGNYFQLTGGGNRRPFSHLVYPLPDPRGGLGIHATLDLSGQVRFGPDVEWLDDSVAPNEIDYQPSSVRLADFERTIRTYWPGLPDDALVPDYAGVRPKIQSGDFEIIGPKVHGVAGLYHLMGMESPGLTSSLAIGQYVADMVE